MDSKAFKRSEKAWIADLNKVDFHNNYEHGFFRGMLRGSQISMGYTKYQILKLKEHIEKTFDVMNFKWTGKRKKNSYIVQLASQKANI